MDSKVSSYFFFMILLLSAFATMWLFFPFLTPVVLAMAGAIVAYPVHKFFLKIFGLGSVGRTLAALSTVVLVLVVILVPLFLLVSGIYAEVQSLYASLIDEANRSQVVEALNLASVTLSNMLFGVFPAQSFDSFNITVYLKDALAWVFSNLDTILSSTVKIAGYALVFLIALFYFLRDGKKLKRLFISWSPLLDKNDEYITITFKRAIRSVFGGSLAVAVLDGLSIGLAFAVFGIPAPALWGTIAAVASLVPGIGISLLIIPGAIYLALAGNYVYAGGLVIWGYAGIVIIDHLIGPALVNKGINIHPFVILLSVLGGIVMFGMVGFILGPIIPVVLFTLFEIYKAPLDNGPVASGGSNNKDITCL